MHQHGWKATKLRPASSKNSWDLQDFTDRAEKSHWDSPQRDATFQAEFEKILTWDDSGAVDALFSSEANGRRDNMDLFSPPIVWAEKPEKTAPECCVPDCADSMVVYESKEDRKKRCSAAWKPQNGHSCIEQSGNKSPVIVGLPGSRKVEEIPNWGIVDCSLQVDSVPIPTGWGDEAEYPKASGWEDTTGTANVNCDIANETGQNGAAIGNSTVCSGWAAFPSSYEHIAPTGWDELPVEPENVRTPSTTWLSTPQQVDDGWGDYSSRGVNAGSSVWGNVYPSVDSRDVYGSSYSGLQQGAHWTPHSYAYWKPKFGDTRYANNCNQNQGRNYQRHGRQVSNMYRVNQDFSTQRGQRWARAKPQWRASGALTHGTEFTSETIISSRAKCRKVCRM